MRDVTLLVRSTVPQNTRGKTLGEAHLKCQVVALDKHVCHKEHRANARSQHPLLTISPRPYGCIGAMRMRPLLTSSSCSCRRRTSSGPLLR